MDRIKSNDQLDDEEIHVVWMMRTFFEIQPCTYVGKHHHNSNLMLERSKVGLWNTLEPDNPSQRRDR